MLPATVIEQAINEDIRSWLGGNLWDWRDAEIKRARTLL